MQTDRIVKTASCDTSSKLKLHETIEKNCFLLIGHPAFCPHHSYNTGKSKRYGVCEQSYLQFRTLYHTVGKHSPCFLTLYDKKETLPPMDHIPAPPFFYPDIGGSICHMDRWRTRNLTTETWRENNVLHKQRRRKTHSSFQHLTGRF